VDEPTLIAAARRGDTQAFNRLVLNYQSLAYNVAFRILGDSDAAADATQEAFLSAFKALRDFRGGSFKAWLLRIVTNACYDHLRYKQRRPSTPLEELLDEEADGEPSFFVDQAEGPEDHALRQELGRLIQRAILTLPPDQRTTLVLSDVQGLSYDEIAEVTQTNLGTVKSRLSRARARLRDYLLTQQELLPARYRLPGRQE
jgi:RNA polymerase sigma-70 factor (ECF subfamily)